MAGLGGGALSGQEDTRYGGLSRPNASGVPFSSLSEQSMFLPKWIVASGLSRWRPLCWALVSAGSSASNASITGALRDIQWIQESVIPGLHALIFRDTAHAPLALPVPPVPLMSAAHSASGGDSDIEHEVLAIGRSRPGCAGQENEFLVLWGDKTCTWEPYKNGARLPVQAVEQALGHPRCTSCSDGR